MLARPTPLISTFALLAACAGAPQTPLATRQCEVTRAAFDIGSGTTKFKVADLDLCRHVTLRVLDADDAPVFYGDDVGRGENAFQPGTMDRGLDVLLSFKQRAASHDPSGFAAVATAAFRSADNGDAFRGRLEHELGFRVALITQAQEARLGFMGAVRNAGVDPRRAVVWDVGNRSMQLTTLRADGKLSIYEGDLASGPMREHVAHEIEGKEAGASPNPISRDVADRAIAFAHQYAAAHVPEAMRQKLDEPGTVVVGIGATKFYGDRPASERNARCDPAHLEARMAELLDKSDEEIGGTYAATAVSDRALLLGFMRALGVDVVRLADIDLTDGLLFENEYYP
jgi:exopolyphosphatase/guanosine-5'-triphosphate,3'-diphosphate pyrophosphatase